MKDEDIHRRNNRYKLGFFNGSFFQIEHTGLTAEQAEAIKKTDRRLTAVQETREREK